jgi:hypothetical protein
VVAAHTTRSFRLIVACRIACTVCLRKVHRGVNDITKSVPKSECENGALNRETPDRGPFLEQTWSGGNASTRGQLANKTPAGRSNRRLIAR